MKTDQNGISHLLVPLVIIIIAVAGFAGWQVWGSNSASKDSTTKTSSPVTDTAQAAKSTPPPSSEERLSLAQGFSLVTGDRLKLNGTRSSDTYNPTATSSVKCVERLTLLASDEEFVNSDQFLITISVCERDPSKDARSWYINDIQDAGDLDGEKTQLTINGNDALKYTSPNGEDVTYAVVSGNYGVFMTGTFFKGDHYSFKNDKDYTPYKADFDAMAKIIKVK